MTKVKKWIKSCYVDFKKIPGWLISISAVTTVLMNILANKTLFSDGAYISLDCGFLVSWVMFLVMDVVTQRYGGKASLSVTIFNISVALGMSSIMWGVAAIPESDFSGWFQSPEASEALNNLIGNNYLVILTSLFAFLVSSIVDIGSNLTFKKIINKSKFLRNQDDKPGLKRFTAYFIRAYGSTFLSQFTDNLVFQMIAYPLLFNIPCTPLSIFVGALIGAVVEMLLELAFAPIGYRAIYSSKKKTSVTVEVANESINNGN